MHRCCMSLIVIRYVEFIDKSNHFKCVLFYYVVLSSGELAVVLSCDGSSLLRLLTSSFRTIESIYRVALRGNIACVGGFIEGWELWEALIVIATVAIATVAISTVAIAARIFLNKHGDKLINMETRKCSGIHICCNNIEPWTLTI